jgi:hypothetical protein
MREIAHPNQRELILLRLAAVKCISTNREVARQLLKSCYSAYLEWVYSGDRFYWERIPSDSHEHQL